MASKKRLNDEAQKQQRDSDLNPIPGITGEGAESTVARPTGGKTEGLFSDPGDGMLGHVGERAREHRTGYTNQAPYEYPMTSGTSISPISDPHDEASKGDRQRSSRRADRD